MNNHLKTIIYIVITIMILSVFWQVQANNFIDYDDGLYIVENQNVKSGLTTGSFSWAFRTGHGGFWFPLTWLSHILDYEIYGLNPRGHHFNSLLLHIINTLLLFSILNRMTGALWKSAFVAVLFAIHPINVEPVAWASSRKDVLSTLFWMFTIWAYSSYCESPDLKRYLAVLLSFILGLMSKPMLVTLPLILILLDYWPLKRNVKALANFNNKNSTLFRQENKSAYLNLYLEKIPFVIISSIFCYIVFLAEQNIGAVAPSEILPVKLRIFNGFTSYAGYISKLFWPLHLSVFYPYPEAFSFLHIVGSILIIVFISIYAFRMKKEQPYILLGWLWYLITLLPVIGIIQVGSHSMADRYLYIPAIGLFIIVVWGTEQIFRDWKYKQCIFTALPIILIVLLIRATVIQIGYWKNTEILFSHSVQVTKNNYRMNYNLGKLFADRGDYPKAEKYYRETLRIKPKHAYAHNNLGILLAEQGKFGEAISQLEQAVQLEPDRQTAHTNLGIIFSKTGDPDRAVYHFNKALQIEPNYMYEYNNLGNVLLKQGRYKQAIEIFNRSLKINPDSPDTKKYLSTALQMENRPTATPPQKKPDN